MSLNPKQQRFVEEYLLDMNATAAARRAGYSAKTAEQQGPRLLGNAGVAVAIAQAQAKRAERVQLTADDVLREWMDIARANPGELVRYRVRACRHCHGKGHQYQWVSQLEWQKAVEDAQARPLEKGQERQPIPSNAGGFGYSVKLRPVASCFRCLGDGITDVMLPDTRDLTPAAARLYAGVKQTKDGIEVKMRDQDAALVNVAKHLGMFKEKVEVTGKDGGPVAHTTVTPEQLAEAVRSVREKF